MLQHKIYTAADLIKINEAWVRKHMTVMGQRLLNELKAVPSVDWEDTPPPKKGICTARSFGRLLSSKQDISEALANYANTCAAKLRKQKSCANLVHVFIQTNTHRTQDKQYYRSVSLQLPVATNHAADIIAMALKGLDMVYKPGYHFKKAGIMVLDLVPEETVQMGIFDVKDPKKDKAVMVAFDAVNARFGKDLVRYAVQGYQRRWKLRQQKLSPCYTTNINQVLIIKN